MPVRIVHDAHADMLNGRAVGCRVLPDLGGKTIIGHVGELDHSHKGQGTIIEAARVMQRSHPDVHFVMVGEGKDENGFRRAAEGLGNVAFAGFVENVEDYLAAFDVFVYPSLREGLGSSLLDAMSFGLPIVASNVGGIPEIVENGVNGLLIEPEKPGELVAALERVLHDGSLRDSMSRENRSRAAEFDADRMTSAYEDIYRSILSAT
jgi:glycosyltransferase involved in cell wall biosynthesis